MESTYKVVVRNEITGEVEMVPVACSCFQDAQIEALVFLFRNQGWRKAVALQSTSDEAGVPFE